MSAPPCSGPCPRIISDCCKASSVPTAGGRIPALRALHDRQEKAVQRQRAARPSLGRPPPSAGLGDHPTAFEGDLKFRRGESGRIGYAVQGPLLVTVSLRAALAEVRGSTLNTSVTVLASAQASIRPRPAKATDFYRLPVRLSRLCLLFPLPPWALRAKGGPAPLTRSSG